MKANKYKSFHNVTVRALEDGGKKYIEGLIPYNSRSSPIWGVIEVIERGAFNRTLTGKERTLALFNHDESQILGNTLSRTLILEDSDAGLLCKCELPNTSYAKDLFEIVSRGDVKTMSFGFKPEKWEYSADGKERTLKDVRLEEVSFGVPFPAYPETTSEINIRSSSLIKRSIDVDGINAILEKDTLTDEDKAKINDLIAALQGVVGGKEDTGEEHREAGEEDTKEEEEITLLETAIELEIIDMESIKKEVDEALEKEEEEVA